ncbi:unnamed protein product [Aphanomyces euteiches]|uniref:BZIP domain-containing protein n=1 Tax=Aphanomyces euteiches TaxID=100861 RepID=A0A6G0X844_9STRA|nr:hypothetical protein Ae201684_007248 [Aphanomyces euteiches]KAH9100457.1 hypothetical protein Ae201684P_006654 [Aphanomyces euteiches]KAH9155780.1 hypothetical protein AeRB84_002277 [Aphanomyces euteiches]
MTLTSLLCSDEVGDHNQQEDQEEHTTAEGASTGQQNSSNSSSPSKTDQKMLDYFMELSNSSDENRKKLTRRVKHRINNKRHRQRKQVELDQLRRDVPELEDQIERLQVAAQARLASAAQRSVWHHVAHVEKKKLDEAVQERDLLQKTIKAHDVLVKLYETQLENLGYSSHMWRHGLQHQHNQPGRSSDKSSPRKSPKEHVNGNAQNEVTNNEYVNGHGHNGMSCNEQVNGQSHNGVSQINHLNGLSRNERPPPPPRT